MPGCLALTLGGMLSLALTFGALFYYLFWLATAAPPTLTPGPAELLASRDAPATPLPLAPGGLTPGEWLGRLGAALKLEALVVGSVDREWPIDQRHAAPTALWRALRQQANPFNACVDVVYPEGWLAAATRLEGEGACVGAACAELASDALLGVCIAHRAEAFADPRLPYAEAAALEGKERWREAPRDALWPDSSQAGACWSTPYELVVTQRGLLRAAWDRLEPWRQQLLVAWARGATRAELASLATDEGSGVAGALSDALAQLQASVQVTRCAPPR